MNLKRYILNNLGAKILCLIVAFALWSYIKGGEIVEREFEVAITPENLPPRMRILSTQKILLRVRGPKGVVDDIKSEDFYLSIDLQGKAQGKYRYPISHHRIKAPWGLEIVDLSPKEISITLEAR
jgi:YbbR domain-containing protein